MDRPKKLTKLIGERRKDELCEQIKSEILNYDGPDNLETHRKYLMELTVKHQMELINCTPLTGTNGYDTFEETFVHSRLIQFIVLLNRKYSRTPELFSLENFKSVVNGFDIKKM